MLKTILKKLKRVVLSPFVLREYLEFKELMSDERDFEISWNDLNPQIFDRTFQTGFDRHYVYHTSWAARKVKEISPARHIDISSSLYFSGIVSAFIPVDFYDLRPASLKLSNFESKKGDLMALPFKDGSLTSLSCMHTIEHVGLGRYGDPLDPSGDMKAIAELKRVVAPGGNLLFVVPIGGRAVIEFNAHRIYTYDQIMKLMDGMTLKEFSLIPEHEENGGLIEDASPELLKNEHYAAGCFWFIKK